MSDAAEPLHIPAQHASDYQRFQRLARLFDSEFRVPGLGMRFGIDPLLGLVPGLGDLAGAAFAVYGIVLARRVGAPRRVQLRTCLNVAIDALAGTVPLLGDLFDLAFKAHVRNARLLDRWLARSTR